MKIHIIKPYSTDKNLGKAYNESVNLIPENDWACVMDYDTMFLTPDCGKILHDYVEKYPDVGIFTALTNRIHPLAKEQLLDGQVSENSDIRYHLALAEARRQQLYRLKDINKPISGFLMMFSRETWKENKFNESGKCLGVDNLFSQSVINSGKSVSVMQGLYVFHLYRINDIKNKTHLL
jgi:hypothetical protein